MSKSDRKLRIGSIQINNSFSGQSYFPYSIGLLQAYAQKHLPSPELYTFDLPIFERVSIEEAVETLKPCDVALFSVYVWNERLSLRIAERLKQENPQCIIVFGGPQVPNEAESYLRNNRFIDVATHGPGEKIICPLLENTKNRRWDGIQGISYLINDVFYTTPQASRQKEDVDMLVSPYLEGIFDPLIAAYPEREWLVLWETNRGCPFSCTFCDWGSATASKVFQFNIETLFEEIDWFSKHKIEFIFCCDANFGILKRDVDIAQYIIDKSHKFGYPKAFSVQNTKNAKDRAYSIQKMLADAGLNKGVTLSMQSVDEATLENIKRSNISLDTYRDLQQRFNRENVETYNDLIIALPGETYESYINGIDTIINNGQHNRIQFNNLSILPNAEMGNRAYQEKYGLELIESDIINIHGSLTDTEEVTERQLLVVATHSMPREDWIKTRAISWLTALIHFDKLLQIPMVMVHELCNLSYRDLIEHFYRADPSEYPIIGGIVAYFNEKAMDIQKGGAEYCPSKQWLNIWWPADELVYIELATTNSLCGFYEEAKLITASLAHESGKILPDALWTELFDLNQKALKMPGQNKDVTISTQYNLWDCYRLAIQGNAFTLEEGNFHYQIKRSNSTWKNWDDWCREVVWYGNKKGAYLNEVHTQSRIQTGPPSSQDLLKRSISGHY